MNQRVPQEDDRQSAGKGFGVAASPLNSVKLELGIILVVGLLLWLAVDSITADFANQLLILALFGGTGALWLVFRTRRTLERFRQKGGNTSDGQLGEPRDEAHETQQK